MSKSIPELEGEIFKLMSELRELQREQRGEPVKDYRFATQTGEVSLSDLFAGRDRLLVIHNMGQGCRYCTLWADGLNPFLPHLESVMSVALVSKDPPAEQRRFAASRQWRFVMASHGGGDYIREQSVMDGAENMPGVVLYERDGEQILRRNASAFGPGDIYCSLWSFLALAGLDETSFTPQYRYWQRPDKLDDGGDNLVAEQA